VDAVDWDYVRFVLEPTRERPSYQYRTCHLDNPLAFGKGQAGTRLLGAGCLEEALDALGVPGSGNRYGDAAKSMALPAASASSEGAEPSSSPANLSDPKPSD
jgi:hypothetical protein